MDSDGTYNHACKVIDSDGWIYGTIMNIPFRAEYDSDMYSRINYLSNPDVEYNDMFIGIADSADNSQKIENRAQTVSEFRTEQEGGTLMVNISGPTNGTTNTYYTWNADIAGGYGPYSYQWSYSSDGISFVNYYSGTSSSLTEIVPSPIQNYWYLKVTVTSSDGQTDTDSHLFMLNNPHLPSISSVEAPFKHGRIDTESSENSTKNILEDITLEVFPNPSSGLIQISIESAHNSEAIIEVLDFAGRLIKKDINRKLNQGNNTIPIDLSNLPKGIYFCKVSANQKIIISKKFIIQ